MLYAFFKKNKSQLVRSNVLFECVIYLFVYHCGHFHVLQAESEAIYCCLNAAMGRNLLEDKKKLRKDIFFSISTFLCAPILCFCRHRDVFAGRRVLNEFFLLIFFSFPIQQPFHQKTKDLTELDNTVSM